MDDSRQTVGLTPPPPGLQANFLHPQTAIKSAIALHTICLVFVTLCILIRIYTRHFISHNLGLDDGETQQEELFHVLTLIIARFLCACIRKLMMSTRPYNHTEVMGTGSHNRGIGSINHGYSSCVNQAFRSRALQLKTLGCTRGLGRHSWDVPVVQISGILEVVIDA